MPKPRVYLAGPDVFLRDPLELSRRKKSLCERYGFEGVFPLDAELDLSGLPPRARALRISRANEELIRSCQLIIAHLTPFRGPSADVGTAYEMGFARGLGLVVFAYTNSAEDFAGRTQKSHGAKPRAGGGIEDDEGLLIESFGHTDNLMLVGAVELSGGSQSVKQSPPESRYLDLDGFEACLREARPLFGLEDSPAGAAR